MAQALLGDGHTAVMSGSLEALEAALDAGSGSAAAPTSLRGVAEAMDDPASLAIEIGPDACASYSGDPLSDEPGIDADLIAETGPLAAWSAMGLATYARAGEPSRARPVLRSSDASAAKADLEPRARLAREGHSQRGGVADSESAYSVEAASATIEIIRLELPPLDGRSRTLMRSFFARDLLPARCDLT